MDAELVAALVAPPLAAVEEGELSELLPVEDPLEEDPLGVRWPQSAFSFALHTAWPLEFIVLAEMHCWYDCSQRKVGMV